MRDAPMRTARVPAGDDDPLGVLARALGPDLAVVFLFLSPKANFRSLAAKAPKLFGGAAIVACTTAGEIAAGYIEDEIVAIGLPSAEFATETVVVEDLDQIETPDVISDMIRADQHLARTRSDLPNQFAFLLVDGTSLREDMLMDVVALGLGAVPLFGGSAGDGTRFRKSLLALDGRVYRNAALITFVRTSCPVRVFSLDHLAPREERMVVTRANPDRRIVQEINAEPAAREYARILGKDPNQLDPFTFAAHPLVVRIGDRYHVRSIQRVNAAGELVFFSAIDEGLVLTLAEPEDLAGALERDLGAIAAEGDLAGIIACDCVLRRIEASQKQRAHVVSEVLRRHNVHGFSTYGEQCGALHVNLTMTGVALFRPRGGT